MFQIYLPSFPLSSFSNHSISYQLHLIVRRITRNVEAQDGTPLNDCLHSCPHESENDWELINGESKLHLYYLSISIYLSIHLSARRINNGLKYIDYLSRYYDMFWYTLCSMELGRKTYAEVESSQWTKTDCEGPSTANRSSIHIDI